jgi:hypothetical protein
VDFYPYSVQRAIVSQNKRDESYGSVSFTGQMNVTSFSTADMIPYVNGWGGSVPNKLLYPVGFQNILAEKLFLKVADTDMELGEELLEAKETITYVANRGRQVLNILKDVVTLNVPGLQNTLGWGKSKKKKVERNLEKHKEPVDKANNLWLEARYAVRPLVISAENAVKIHNEGTTLIPSNRLRVKVQVIEPLKGSSISGSVHDSYTGTAKHRMCGDLELLDISGLRNLALGTDSAGLLWAGVPLSFAADWVFNVGNFIKASQVQSRCKFVVGSQSLKVTGTATRKTVSSGYPTQNNILSIDVDCYGRWVLGNLSIVLPRVTNPLNTDTGLPRAIDAFALLWQTTAVGK